MLSNKYYSLDNILKNKAQYNMIIGERSNGKTYACLYKAVENYVKYHKKTAYIRRWQDDFKGKRGATLFESLASTKAIEKLTNGKWTDVYYYSGRWYLCKWDEKNIRVNDTEPFAYGFAISAMEHDKSTSYPDVTTIIFDEFLTRGVYLPDEFVLFMNVISTIVRDRYDVTIFMLGNTVNKYCPYFEEMGLTRIKDMKQGQIDVYEYGESNDSETQPLKVAVEYCGSKKSKKNSDTYFAFNNPKLSMITNGVWELDLYPHCPYKYKPKDILYTYFIQFDKYTLQCEIIQIDDIMFTFIHMKTSPIKGMPDELIYNTEYNPNPNYRRSILKARTSVEGKILWFFKNDLVFYQNNDVGEIVKNYINWCKSN